MAAATAQIPHYPLRYDPVVENGFLWPFQTVGQVERVRSVPPPGKQTHHLHHKAPSRPKDSSMNQKAWPLLHPRSQIIRTSMAMTSGNDSPHPPLANTTTSTMPSAQPPPNKTPKTRSLFPSPTPPANSPPLYSSTASMVMSPNLYHFESYHSDMS